MRAVTINDVAKQAGVSKRTVTRVLNNHSDVKESTRRKVKNVIEELGYVPNSLAQRLASGHSELIGVYAYAESFPLERTQFFYPFVEGVEIAAARLAYDVILFTRGGTGCQRSMFVGQTTRTDLADGLIILGAQVNHDDLRHLTAMNRPFVCIGRREAEDYPLSYAAADYKSAFYEATVDVMQHGHRRIGYISALDFEAEIDKFAGYKQALTEAGLPVLYGDPQDTLGTDGIHALKEFLLENEITALFIPYPHHLPPLLEGLRDLGISIPRDLSLVGFDTQDILIDGLPINSITLPKEDMGQQAVEMLVELIRSGNKENPLRCTLPCSYSRGKTVLPITNLEKGGNARP